jgi:hypothetical protein
MATAQRFRRQAATCANLAKQTHDEESRQRCLRLEQIYLHFAETEDRFVNQIGALPGERETRPAGTGSTVNPKHH